MTYAELRDKISTLTDEQLAQPVQFFPDERPPIKLEFDIFTEDCLVDPDDDEDVWMRSDLEKYLAVGAPADETRTADDFDILVPAGTVSLH